MKKFLILSLLVIPSLVYAGGPSFRHKDPVVEQEFEDVYRNIQNAKVTMTNWEVFTPTGSWTSNVSYTGVKRRVGDTLEVKFSGTLTGTPNSTTLVITLPNSLVIDTSKLASASGSNPVGSGMLEDAGVALVPAVLLYSSTTGVIFRYLNAASTNLIANGMGDSSTPFSWGSGDKFYGSFSVPISGWTYKN